MKIKFCKKADFISVKDNNIYFDINKFINHINDCCYCNDAVYNVLIEFEKEIPYQFQLIYKHLIRNLIKQNKE